MGYTAAGHQGAIHMVRFHFRPHEQERVMLLLQERTDIVIFVKIDTA